MKWPSPVSSLPQQCQQVVVSSILTITIAVTSSNAMSSSSITNVAEVKAEAMGSTKPAPLWEGTLTWPSSQNTAAPFCELIAYPRPDIDPAS